jgi:RND family efflux transporter MFP subunit
MKKAHFFLLPLVFFAGLISAGCDGETQPMTSGGATASAAEPKAPVAVNLFEVHARAKEDRVIPAVLSTESTAMVIAPRDGVVLQILAEEGAAVKKGDALARLNDEDLRSQFSQAELEVSRLLVEERQYEATVKVNQTELEQEAMLLKDGLTSKRQYDRSKYRLDGSIQELEKMRLATQTARAHVEDARAEVEKCTVRAPISGVITHRYANLGTSLVRNDKLFEVAQVASLEVKFQWPQSEPDVLAPGRMLQLTLAGNDRVIAQARIRRMDPTIDALSNTRGYLADVIGGSGLVPGQAVSIRLPQSGAAGSLWIPRAAFPPNNNPRPGTPIVLFVFDGKQAMSRIVWINESKGDLVEVTSGLVAGDRVILSPPSSLKAGDLVQK